MKNLYQILGVLDTAEDIVIRAAYKALAQRYHPDKWQGNAEEATVRMREINDAYRILSNPIEKEKYDKTIDRKEYQEESDVEEDIDAYLEEAWKVGLLFFPILEKLYRHLRKINYALGNTFKIYLIENKAFDDASKIAREMERNFLIKYFGEENEILSFVKVLILRGNKHGVWLLNKYINILGASVKPSVIIETVKKEIGFDNDKKQEVIAKYLATRSTENAFLLLRAFEYEVIEDKEWRNGLQSFVARKRNGQGLIYNFTNSSLLDYCDKLLNEYVNKN